jgi:glycosyltransferase involved in cell wall biosynthesis
MNLSIIIPLLNEQESLPELHQWIVKVMTSHNYSYEVIFIDDGSSDNSWKIIEQLSNENSNAKGIHFQRNFGKSQALHAGFAKAKGDVVITMDADLQDSPDEIPDLYNMIINQNYDLVSGWKKKRYDSVVSKNLPSKLFNWAARKTSGVHLNDFNCGLKAYKNIVIKNIEVSGEMHRYIPVLAKNAGFSKIGQSLSARIHFARQPSKRKRNLARRKPRRAGRAKIGWHVQNDVPRGHARRARPRRCADTEV